MIDQAPPKSIAAFIAEPVAGATLGAAVPCEDYWPAMAEVCRRHGVFVIADEVMTGFGRTGRWFGVDHWQVRPDIMTAGKGTTGGYVPVRLRGGESRRSTTPWRPPGSSTGSRGRTTRSARRRAGRCSSSSATRTWWRAAQRWASGSARPASALADCPIVGDIRGLGTMIGIELVRDAATKEPFVRTARVTERVVAHAREHELLALLLAPATSTGSTATSSCWDRPSCSPTRTRPILVERTAAAIRSVA